MIRKLVRRLTVNWGLKIIALIVAVGVWFFVTTSNDPISTRVFTNVPINIINSDSIADIGKVVEPEGTGTVNVKVRERQSVLNKLSRSGTDFYVEADLENINAMNSVPLTVTCSNSMVTWDEIEITPSSLKVKLENKVEQAFPVSVNVAGSPGSGYAVGTTEIEEGKNILIAGPESIINIIGQVTAPVSVEGIRENTKLSAQLRIYDRNDALFTDSQMSRLEFKDSDGNLLVNQSVSVKVNLWKVRKDLPLRVETTGTPEDGYYVSGVETIPGTISIAATQEVLDAIGGTFIADDKISVEGISSEITREIDLTPTLQSLGNVKLLNDDDPTISVTVEVQKSGDKTFHIPLGSIELDNKPTKMKLVFTPADELDLSVRAVGDASVSKLKVDDIKVKLDLAECSKEGKYEIPLQVTLPEGYELNNEVTVTVSVTPEQAEPGTEGTVIKSVADEDERATE